MIAKDKNELSSKINVLNRQISNIEEKGITPEQENNIITSVQGAILETLNPKFNDINTSLTNLQNSVTNLQNSSVQVNQDYFIQAITKGGYLSDQGGKPFVAMASPDGWERMQFRKA